MDGESASKKAKPHRARQAGPKAEKKIKIKGDAKSNPKVNVPCSDCPILV
jgi:hypothetical protein